MTEESKEIVELPAGSSDSQNGDHQPSPAEREAIQDMLRKLVVQHNSGDEAKKHHAFWATQPVAQFTDDPANMPQEDGPIDKPKTIADVRQEPYKLPEGFEWCLCNLNDAEVVKEVYTLLTYNYVEDDEAMFRFKYSQEFLKWALHPPDFRPEWHLGVRYKAKLMGFITGVPATITVNGQRIAMVEINFLCVHKKLRTKRLAPVLIKEITRRVNLAGVWQAAYTAGVVLPKPVAECQYWHRSLNPKKLIAIGFSRLQPRLTLARTIKLYKLPDQPQTPGLRLLERRDLAAVTDLLAGHLSRYALAPSFSQDEVAHYLMPVEGVVASYVVESPAGLITDLLSYYTLPSTVIGNDKYSELKAAFQYYTVATETPLLQLTTDALILARNDGHDVFNALDIFENSSFLRELKFGIGDGRLRYYLYNWRVRAGLQSKDVGLILL